MASDHDDGSPGVGVWLIIAGLVLIVAGGIACLILYLVKYF